MVWTKIKNNWLVIVTIFVAFYLRTFRLYENLFFGWEQGRDFLKYGEILSGDIVLVGPKTDIAGIFHGALSYYLYLPLYILLRGSPYLVLLTLILLNVLSIYLLYKLTEKIFNPRIAYLASVFYALSYSSVIYSRWLIHTNLVPALVIISLYSVVHSIKQQKFLLIFAISFSVALHLSIQMSATLLIIFLIFYLKYKPKYNKKLFLGSIFAMLLFISPFIIFDVKNAGISRNAAITYLQNPKEEISRASTFDEFKNELRDNIYPNNLEISLGIFMFALAFLTLNKSRNTYLIISLLLVMPLVYYLTSFKPLRHFYVYLSPILSIFLAIFIIKLSRNSKAIAILILGSIIYGNLTTVFKRLPESEGNFIHHAQRTYLKDEISLIDYVYQDAQGNNFTYNYYSVPYWQPQAWEYLFKSYGKNKYGYEPIINTRTEVFYVLYEPDETQPLYQENWLKELNKQSVILNTHKSGKLTAEKRKLI